MIPFGEVVGGGWRKRDSASSKLKLKNQASLSLGPVSTFFSFFLPFFEIALSLLMHLPIFWPVVLVACHPKSLPDGNVTLLTSCVSTAVPGFGTPLALSSIWRSYENPVSSGKARKSKAAGVLAVRYLVHPSAKGLPVHVV